MLMKKETGQSLVALTSIFCVELPGIEPDALPRNMPSELPVRSVSFQFSTARYQQIRFRVLTASTVNPAGGTYALLATALLATKQVVPYS
jgi:hypothetical protein